MENEDLKKYNCMENILQKINQKYVALPEEEKKRNNKFLQITDRISQKLCSRNTLFKNLFQREFYGGSYYDNLKVGKPNEYDLDWLLTLPKFLQPTVEVSDRPGYVFITLKNLEAMEKIKESEKYKGLEKLLEGNRLSTKKVRSWMEGLMTTALSGISEMTVKMGDDDSGECNLKLKEYKNGPGHTIKLEGVHNNQSFNIDIDVVPCFTFFDDQWPKKDYRANPTPLKKEFFVVPKSPDDDTPFYWRLSFQEQERELISGYAVMKPTIRLIKKIRDRYQHITIASYYIKTVFLWELENNSDKSFWAKSLSYVFMMMLRKYSEYLAKKNIPYYWNNNNNLIENVPEATTSCIANKIKNIVNEIDRIYLANPYGIVQHLLTKDDVDLETFKQEVPLSKKHLKQLQNIDSSLALSPSSLPLSPSSSAASSFECIAAPEDSPTSQIISNDMQKLEIAVLTVASEQKRMIGLLEAAVEKIDKCEEKIQQLQEAVRQKNNHDEIMNMLRDLNGKVQDLVKQKGPPAATSRHSAVDDLLSLGDNLKNTLDHQIL